MSITCFLHALHIEQFSYDDILRGGDDLSVTLKRTKRTPRRLNSLSLWIIPFMDMEKRISFLSMRRAIKGGNGHQ